MEFKTEWREFLASEFLAVLLPLFFAATVPMIGACRIVVSHVLRVCAVLVCLLSTWSFWKKKKARWIHLLIMISDSGLCYIIEYGRPSWILDCRNGMSLLWIDMQRYLAILENFAIIIHIYLNSNYVPAKCRHQSNDKKSLTDRLGAPAAGIHARIFQWILIKTVPPNFH